MAVALGTEAHAASIVYDFSTTTDNTTMVGQSAGTGWAQTWGPGGTSGRLKLDKDLNLTFSLGGYNIAQTGTGRGYGDYSDFRGINRVIDTNLTGTVWFSILVQNVAVGDHAGLQFNTHADGTGYSGIDYTRGAFDVQLSGTSVVVRYNNTDTTISGPVLALNTTHLLVGRITLQDNGANDRLELWADPTDLLNLSAPLFNSNTADLGADIYLAGVFGYGAADTLNSPHGSFDALRMSDGGGDAGIAFSQVTGVPEPSAALLAGCGLGLGLTFFRRRPSRLR